jgi:putative ABC transport system permease protein
MTQESAKQIKATGSHVFLGNNKLALFLAFKSIIKGNRWAIILVILVMAFSFVNLIFVSSLISGITVTMDNQMITNNFGNVVIGPRENKYYIEKSSILEDKINTVQGVAAITPRLSYSAFFEYEWKEKLSQKDKGKSGIWEVSGIDPEREQQVTTLHKHLIAGNYLDSNDREQIILGVEIAGGSKARTSGFLTLGGAKVGDKVRLTYPNGVQREYTVKGITYAREMNRADRTALVTREEMLSVMDREIYFDRASLILVKAKEGVDEATMIADIKATGINEQVKSWREYGGAQSSVVSTFDVIGSLIGSVGLIVSAIVMFIVVYINVLNKKRQIGILRAIGIPNIAIIGSYIYQAFFFAIAGTLIGWILVNFMVQPYFQFYPLDLPIGRVSLSVQAAAMIGSALGLSAAGVLAGFIPSWTIMKQSIITIIWGT